MLLLQHPRVQNYLAQKTAAYLTKKTHYPINIDKVAISWFDFLEIKGLVIKDPNQTEMIGVDNCMINFDFMALLGQEINIEEITLNKPEIRLIKDSALGDFNINIFADALSRQDQKTTSKKGKPFVVQMISINNGYFKFSDQTKPDIPEGFNYNHFEIEHIGGSFSDFRQSEDTVQIHVEGLSGVDKKTGLTVHQFDTDFGISDSFLKFENVYAHVGESKIRKKVNFHFEEKDDLSDFNTSVNMDAVFDSTIIRPQELQYFAPVFQKFKDKWLLSGNFNGKVTDFSLNKLELGFGQGSRVSGNMHIKGLPDFQETLFDLQFERSTVQAADLRQYFDDQSSAFINRVAPAHFSGRFFGFAGDFVTNGSFHTALGLLNMDVNFKLNKNDIPFYKGSISTKDFQLGKLLGQEQAIGKLDMNGSVKGSGLKPGNADFFLKSDIRKLEAYNYTYTNITTNAKFARERFSGSLDIKDSNLVVDAIGEIKLGADEKIVDVNAKIKKARFDKLNLTGKTCNVITNANADFSGASWSELYGKLQLSNTEIEYDRRFLDLAQLDITSEQIGNLRNLTVNSNLGHLRFYGNWELKYLYTDIHNLYQEYMLQLNNDDSAIGSYYRLKENVEPRQYQLYYVFELDNINPVLDFIESDFRLARHTRVAGDFQAGNYTTFNLYSYTDSLQYKKNVFQNNKIDVSVSKFSKSPEVLATGTIYSESQDFNNNLQSENLDLEAVWSTEKIDFSGSIQQSNANNAANINGELSFLSNDTLKLQFSDSHFKLLNESWNMAENNEIKVIDKMVDFKNVRFTNKNQKIALNGKFSKKKTQYAKLQINDFELRLLNKLIDENLGGNVNGYMKISDVYNNLSLESNMTIEDFVIDNFLIGTVKGKSLWNNENQVFDVDFDIHRNEKNIFNVTGSYDPKQQFNQLNLKAHLNETNLIILEPFIKDNFSELSGTGSGNIYITGTPSYPILNGQVNINHGAFKINYLNTRYFFSDNIYISENRLGFRSLKLSDVNGNAAIVDGGLYHDGFTNWVLNLSAALDHFMILNTNEDQNNLYYGQAIATGNFEALGGLNNLKLSANLRSNKGTDINIPLSSEESVEKQEFITFVSDKKADDPDSAAGDKVDLSGIKMDLNLELTNDAHIAIIFDKKAGERIEGRGQGQIRLEIDTRGDFNMFGEYVFNKGSYTYNLLHMISKEFQIEKGSSISWSGSPYKGQLDVTAEYEQQVSLKPIVDMSTADSTFLERPELQRRYPVATMLNLKGDLLRPDISYGIDIKEYPQTAEVNLFNYVTNFESRIQSDPRQLNRQVFSLLVMKRLAPLTGSFLGGGAATASTGSVSELLSNQFSYWVSQVDENLQVDFNLDGLNKDALNKVQVRMSYNFMEGRLRVTRAGSFTNSRNQATAASIAGEWTVEYMLSKDGRFRIRLFNRNNPNVLDVGNNNGTNTTAGFSIMHTENFNSLGELLGKEPKKKNKNVSGDQDKNKTNTPPQKNKSKNGPRSSDAYRREEYP